MFKVLIVFVSLIFASVSFATIESEGLVRVPYQPAQAGVGSFDDMAANWNESWMSARQYCFANRMFFDPVSSSPYPIFDVLTQPYFIPVSPRIAPFEPEIQINELFDGILRIGFDAESLDRVIVDPGTDQWVREPRFVVDVSGYDQSTPGGRLESMVKAKLAVVAIHQNLSRMGPFRADIEVVGLPADQSEFVKPGFRSVVPRTQSPYSASSPLALTYLNELIDPSFCR